MNNPDSGDTGNLYYDPKGRLAELFREDSSDIHPDIQDVKKDLFKLDYRLLIWRTLQIGGKSPKDLLREFDKSVSRASYPTQSIMKDDFPTLSRVREVKLSLIKVRTLGFTQEPSYADFIMRGREFGLSPCPWGVAPHLRLSYSDQPAGEMIQIATELSDDSSKQKIFSLSNRFGTKWLDVSDNTPEDSVRLEQEMVWTLDK